MHRNYCVTIQKPTTEYNEQYIKPFKEKTKYGVIGLEIGQETGNIHYQCYFELKSPTRMSTMAKLLPGAHFEARIGSAKQASDYCKKDGKFTEWGEISKQGFRSDLAEAANAIVEQHSLKEVALEHPEVFIKYSSGITKLHHMAQPDRDPENPPMVMWIWGETGVGKTRAVREAHNENVYIKDGTQWWDGYNYEEAILIDDFDGKWPYRDLLRLIDRNKYSGQTKGGYIKINSPFIYITCDKPPEAFWSGKELAQIKRRLFEIINLGQDT